MTLRNLFSKKSLICTAAFTLLFTINAYAFETSNQIATVGNLLLKSSAARKIALSDDQEVQATYTQAKKYYELAQASAEPAEVQSLLALAIQHMVKAGKMADMGAALGDKKQHDFDNRLASIQALLTAQESVADVNESSAASQVRSQVDELLSRAQSQYQQGDYVMGRQVLDEAYGLLKVSIEKMRGGDTLVNSLVFDTPADEFNYYQTKTTSQLTALTLFKEKAAPGKERMIDSITKAANGFIEEANALAKSGDYQAAIPLMEKALTRLQSGLMMALN